MANSITTFSFFMIFSCCIAFLTPATTCSSNETDLLSLLALKAAVDLDPHGALNSWNATTTNFCRWNGVQCGGRHPNRIIGIYLQSQGLVGSLSPHIGNLSFLTTINLQNNSFRGQIPQEITLLRRLQYVRFQNNAFSGTVLRNLSQCPNLVYINMNSNNLSGVIPPDLGFLQKLEFIGFSNNSMLTGSIPHSIGNITSLAGLSLRYCSLQGEIPESIAQLRNLILFQVGFNNLTGIIPPGLFNISTLEDFVVDYNGLHGSIPDNIGLTLPSLTFLSLGKNQFSGPVPNSLSNASSLQILVLSGNYFTGLMPRFGGLPQLQGFYGADNLIEDDISLLSSLTNCTYLRVLDIGQNLLSGSIPDTIANLSSNLDGLKMDSTQVHGEIPSSGIENLVGLTSIILNDNYLEGPIPLGFGGLYNLQELDLGGNMFTGDAPSNLGNLTLLNSLSLQRNNLSGTIPRNFANFTNLLQLSLSRNRFNGPIPREILSISSISISLDLSYNAFVDSIPLEVGSLRNLVELDLSNNRLSGLIPDSLGMCMSLQRLHLEGNLFEGHITQGLSSLLGLVDLDLSRNNLSGPIPSFLGQLHLQKLNLSFNRLQGEVPMSGVFKNSTAISLEGNIELCGGLKLPPCTSTISSKKHPSSSLIKIMIPITGGVAIIISLVLFIYKRRMSSSRRLSSVPSFIRGTGFLRLSYSDLLKATSGFSGINLIGSGRFGSVYKGILDDGPHKVVAVKVLNLTVQGASKSFIAECNALRFVRHRGLLKILSTCESIDFQGNDFKALVYEFKASGSLEKWLYNDTEQQEEGDAKIIRNLDMIERLNISIDIAQALEYLHYGTDSAIVHGDLKPSNILLDQDMTACVGDFGLAKIISSILPSDDHSHTVGIKGTIGYVPPEYGMSNSVSKEGDVYSYGILVLEMFTRRRPTDDMFNDHPINLHSFVSTALPDRVMEIVDPLILIGPHRSNSKIEDCMASVLSIGMWCSKEMPRERMSMTNVVSELHKTRSCFLATE